MRPLSPAPGKKPYETPRLSVYGHIQEITLAIAMNTKNADGGVGQTDKTG